MVWSIENARGNESAKIRWEIVPFTKGMGLDLGCGASKAFPHFIGVDNGHHEKFGYQIKPDVMVKSCDDLTVFGSQSMDFVYSSHLLEHIEDTKKALKEWWRIIKPGGHLVLYLPHKKFYPNIGTDGANPDHKHDFLPEDIISAMREVNGWDLLENQERNGDDEYSFFQVYERMKSWTSKEPHRESWKKEKPAKSVGLVRYGAFGDLMQASSVAKGLKDEGFHVTLFTSPPGSDVIMNDPNIDRFIIQDKDQVPNGNLGEYWDHWAKKFDRWVNLSESVEGTLLAMHGRPAFGWAPLARHKKLNHNYLEFQHELAQIPHKPQVKFFATLEEKQWAQKQRQRMGDFAIMWSLAGSALHKVWPHLDQVVARIMIEYKNAHIAFVGGPETSMLEAGWENEPRVHRQCGKWSIRQSLAFLEVADLVIGTETGVLNAAACMPVPKVITLSHSSVENLTRDWVNTRTLFSKNTPCYPCHMLHQNNDGFKYCKQHEKDGVAECQFDIHPSEMWDAVRLVMDEKLRQAA